MNQIMNAADMDRTITRMTYEILERYRQPERLVLIGIERKGALLAFRIAKKAQQLGHNPIPVASLDITAWRDDPKRKGQHFRLPISVQDRQVILIDDVLASGRTVRAAMNGIVHSGRPSAIRLAVLIDRGHRELPIRPDLVGKNIPTSSSQTVRVRFQEKDGEEGVWLL